MKIGLNEKIFNLVLKGTRDQRLFICEQEPLYFAIYYFTEYFDYKIPPFHYELYQDCKDLASGNIEEAMWCIFRDAAKTSIAKIAFACWLICFRKKKYINWDSYDGDNSEAALFDITLALQTNKKIISDFGQIYHKKTAKNALMEAKMKRIKSFITETGIKVQAFTTQESTRGRVQGKQRPDCFIIDDFENSKTRDSYPITKKIKDHIDELRSGLPANACVLYLCNYITEEGSVAYLMEKIKENPRGRVRNIPVQDKTTGVIAWPDKFVLSLNEATALNATITDSRKWKISLEARRKSLGKNVYESEMMNNPAYAADKIFDRDKVEELLRGAKDPVKEIGGFKIWSEYNSAHRYGIGADTAKGVGIDSNASVHIDFSTIPNRVVATYKNNMIGPDIFAHELVREAALFGNPLLAPESNNTGYATVTQLKALKYPNIFVPLRDEKVKEVMHTDYGWDTNSATKPEMIYQLKTAIEDGLLVTFDKDLLNEMKYYAQKDLQTYRLEDGMTRHYDLLIACAIAWAMRNFAKVSKDTKPKFKQGAHMPASEYGG